MTIAHAFRMDPDRAATSLRSALRCATGAAGGLWLGPASSCLRTIHGAHLRTCRYAPSQRGSLHVRLEAPAPYCALNVRGQAWRCEPWPRGCTTSDERDNVSQPDRTRGHATGGTGERVACGQPSALKDVWLTNTRAAGRAEWGSRNPSRFGGGLKGKALHLLSDCPARVLAVDC
jgi:hypothetical protein